MKPITKWFEKHINFKSENEFMIFLVWSIFSALLFFSLLNIS
jgi:hypothetical protein